MAMRRSLLLVPLLTACYTHAAIEPRALRSGTSIRARISAATAEGLESVLGVSDARLLTGVVVTTSADTVIVEVPTSVRAEVGSSVRTLKQRVAIPRASIVEIESRTVDRRRTTLLVGSVAVVAGILIVKTVHGGPGSERPPGGGPPEPPPR